MLTIDITLQNRDRTTTTMNGIFTEWKSVLDYRPIHSLILSHAHTPQNFTISQQ